MKECPFCGAEVKRNNFNRHLRRVHSELEEEEFEKEGLAMPVVAVTTSKLERDEKKKTESRKRRMKRKASRIAMIVAFIVIISVVGVFVYQNISSNNESNEGNGGTNGNGGGGNPVAVMTTSLGTIKIELYTDWAPDTVGNFINLANSSFYDGLIFHRVVPDFVIQGGGFTPEGQKRDASSIPYEYTGYKNKRYTIAMARSGDPNSQSDSGSASSQFFINLNNNSNLDDLAYPYVVFGKVVDGFNVVDTIGALSTGTYYLMSDWPDNPPVIHSVTIQY